MKIATRDPPPPQGQPAHRRARPRRCSSCGPRVSVLGAARRRDGARHDHARASSSSSSPTSTSPSSRRCSSSSAARSSRLWLDRRRPALGSRFQTKLLVTYIGLTAIPIALVFFSRRDCSRTSIDRWFSTPVRQVVEQARAVQDRAERRILAAGARSRPEPCPPPLRGRAERRGRRSRPAGASGASIPSRSTAAGAAWPSPRTTRRRRRSRPRRSAATAPRASPSRSRCSRRQPSLSRGLPRGRPRRSSPASGCPPREARVARRDRRRLERVSEARGAEAGDQGGQHLDLPPHHARDPLRRRSGPA